MKKNCFARFAAAALSLAMLAGCGGGASQSTDSSAADSNSADSVELTVFAAASMTETLNQIAEDYKAVDPNVTLTFNFASSGDLLTQIKEGADCDVFISAAPKQMNALDGSLKDDTDKNPDGLDELLDGTRIDLLENKVTLAVPEGNPKGVQSFDDLAEKLASGDVLLAIGNSDVPVGQYTQKIFAHYGLDEAALASSGFSYIALGHIHRPEILLDKKMAYCGSPEPLDKTETGRHGILYGEIDPESCQVTTLDFIPMAKLRYIPLIVRVTPDTTNTELYLKIAHEIEQRGNDNIFRFKVQGMRDPDISFDLDALKLRFRIADIIDETEPQYDFSALFAEHPSDMIGFYIQALKKPDMSPVEKKALFYGIHALLLTTDERS